MSFPAVGVVGMPLFQQTAASPNNAGRPRAERFLDVETKQNIEKFTSKASQYLQVLANEPSVGLYRIQEHVRKSIPELVERKKILRNLSQKLHEHTYDVEYAVLALKEMRGATFKDVSASLFDSIKRLENALNAPASPSFFSPPAAVIPPPMPPSAPVNQPAPVISIAQPIPSSITPPEPPQSSPPSNPAPAAQSAVTSKTAQALRKLETPLFEAPIADDLLDFSSVTSVEPATAVSLPAAVVSSSSSSSDSPSSPSVKKLVEAFESNLSGLSLAALNAPASASPSSSTPAKLSGSFVSSSPFLASPVLVSSSIVVDAPTIPTVVERSGPEVAAAPSPNIAEVSPIIEEQTVVIEQVQEPPAAPKSTPPPSTPSSSEKAAASSSSASAPTPAPAAAEKAAAPSKGANAKKKKGAAASKKKKQDADDDDDLRPKAF